MISGFEIVFVVLGLVQLSKRFGLKGNGLFIEAVVLGLFFFGLEQAIALEMLSQVVLNWLGIIISGVAKTLAIPGLYDVAKDEMLPAIGKALQ